MKGDRPSAANTYTTAYRFRAYPTYEEIKNGRLDRILGRHREYWNLLLLLESMSMKMGNGYLGHSNRNNIKKFLQRAHDDTSWNLEKMQEETPRLSYSKRQSDTQKIKEHKNDPEKLKKLKIKKSPLTEKIIEKLQKPHYPIEDVTERMYECVKTLTQNWQNQKKKKVANSSDINTLEDRYNDIADDLLHSIPIEYKTIASEAHELITSETKKILSEKNLDAISENRKKIYMKIKNHKKMIEKTHSDHNQIKKRIQNLTQEMIDTLQHEDADTDAIRMECSWLTDEIINLVIEGDLKTAKSKSSWVTPDLYEWMTTDPLFSRPRPYLAEDKVSTSLTEISRSNMDNAFSRFFLGVSRYPRYKAKGKSDMSYYVLNNKDGTAILIVDGILKTPTFTILLKMHRPLPEGRILSARIKKDSIQHVHISIVVEGVELRASAPDGTRVGIDINMRADGKAFCVLYDGNESNRCTFIDFPPKIIKQIKFLNGKIDAKQHTLKLKNETQKKNEKEKRKTLHSKTYDKTLRSLNKTYNKKTIITDEALHIISEKITKQFSVVYMEDPFSAALMKKKNPDKTQEQESDQKRTMLDLKHGELRRMIAYKLARRGGTLIYINPKDTSLTCPYCGHVNEGSSDILFRCGGPLCTRNKPINRHAVGAINIFRKGLEKELKEKEEKNEKKLDKNEKKR